MGNPLKWLAALFSKPSPLPQEVAKPGIGYPPPYPPVKPEPPPTLREREEWLRDRLVALWLRDKGMRETGFNRGPLVDTINQEMSTRYYGLPGRLLGKPYCISALIVRGVLQLAKEEGLKVPRWMITPGTQEFWGNAPTKYRFPVGLSNDLAKKADFGLMRNYNDSGKGHAYGFTRPEDPDVQHTAEYNTDGEGSREGDGFWEKGRTRRGDTSKKYLGHVDVIRALIDYNS